MSTTKITRLYAYPVKSCGAVSLPAAKLERTGLPWDRAWMIVDEVGSFVTQRSHPQMARIACQIDTESLTLACAGMPDLTVRIGEVPTIQAVATIWGERFTALDEGDHAAAWVSEYLGGRFRLVRWDHSARRTSDAMWTGTDIALNRFNDGFPLLLIGDSSLADLNARMPEPLPMDRFRPNLVISGLEPYEEDYLDTLTAGAVKLRVVKPCTRCEITTTDQRTGARGQEPLRTLATYRANPRVGGGITFGQNVIVAAGVGETLHEGMELEAHWRF